ncbi:hypothetical protein BJF78_30795 [Pseudonocardia sp. CNS-139]|nr:hypothetical protein BJF78_30795 [Pseudonocardia sp. CNS-139]
MSASPDAWAYVSLTFEQNPGGVLVARLVVDGTVGPLVEVEIPGEDIGRLLVGETVAASARIGTPVSSLDEVRPLDRETTDEPHPDEPSHEPHAAAHAGPAGGTGFDIGPDVVDAVEATGSPARGAGEAHEAEREVVAQADPVQLADASPGRVYGAVFTEPPAGTEPIRRGTDLDPDEPVVGYINGRWRNAVAVRRDAGSILAGYTRPGPFGQVLQRLSVTEVRRLLTR